MACRVCHKLFSEDSIPDDDAKPHVCTICGLSFSLKIQLKRHILIHNNGAPFVCVRCFKTTKTSKSYNLRLSTKGTKQYVCDVCTQSFITERLLERHKVREHSTPISIDSSKLLTKGSPAKHGSIKIEKTTDVGEDEQLTTESSANTKKFECKHCNRVFSYSACYTKHLRKGSCKDSGALDSPIHEESAKNKKVRLDEESPQHRPDTPFVFSDDHDRRHTCHICEKTFVRKSSLEGHMTLHFSNSLVSEEDSSSSLEEVYGNEAKDGKHPQFDYKISKSFSCDHCNFVCFSKSTFEKHLTAHKQSDEKNNDISSEESKDDAKRTISKKKKKSFSCDHCSFQCFSNHTFQMHLATHKSHAEKGNETSTDSESDSSNDVANAEDASSTVPKKEKTQQEKPSYLCDFCDREFTSTNWLYNHACRRKNKFSKRRRKGYACAFCDKRFVGETCLKKHEYKRHGFGNAEFHKTKKKDLHTFKCKYCNEEFVGKRTMFVKHMHMHEPEVCGICDKRFVDRPSLREHCKSHVGTEEGRMFMQCSQKHLDARNGMTHPDAKVEYIYLLVR